MEGAGVLFCSVVWKHPWFREEMILVCVNLFRPWNAHIRKPRMALWATKAVCALRFGSSKLRGIDGFSFQEFYVCFQQQACWYRSHFQRSEWKSNTEILSVYERQGFILSRISLMKFRHQDISTFPLSQARRGIKISHLDTLWKSGSSLVPWNSGASFKRHPGFGIAHSLISILRHLSTQLHLDSIPSGKRSVLQSCREQPPKALHQ